MAVTVESTTNLTSYGIVNDVGTSGEFLVTKPTGLTAGDMLFVATSSDSTVTPPSGWSTGTLPNDQSVQTDYFYKLADSSDAAASNFTFATASDSAKYMYSCLRLSGCATSRDPVVATAIVDTDDTPTSISETLSPTVNVPAGSVAIIFVGKDSQTTTGVTAILTDYALTGASLTFTELMDADLVGDSEDGAAFAYAEVVSSSTITGITMTATSSKTPPTIFNVNVLYIYPQQDATENLTLTSTNQTAFAPAGQAGATTALTTTETTQTKFDPTGTTSSPTSWTNEAEVSTTWTNEQQL